MMTIRMTTGQNDLDVAVAMLKLAYDTGVSDMRTKWFSISPTGGLKFKQHIHELLVLDRVRQKLIGRTDVTNEEFLFASYIGVKFDEASPGDDYFSSNPSMTCDDLFSDEPLSNDTFTAGATRQAKWDSKPFSSKRRSR